MVNQPSKGRSRSNDCFGSAWSRHRSETIISSAPSFAGALRRGVQLGSPPPPPRSRTWEPDVKVGPDLMIVSDPPGPGTDPKPSLVLDRALDGWFTRYDLADGGYTTFSHRNGYTHLMTYLFCSFALPNYVQKHNVQHPPWMRKIQQPRRWDCWIIRGQGGTDK